MPFCIAKNITRTNRNIHHLLTSDMDVPHKHWGKADDRNCNYGQPKMAHVESGTLISNGNVRMFCLNLADELL
jgi:hypothetical protein